MVTAQVAVAGDDVYRGGPALGGARGVVAAYRDAGGARARVFGKPSPDFYRGAREAAARHGAANVVVVGDSLDHDVAGANAAGLDVAWLCPAFFEKENASHRRLDASAHRPDFVLRSLGRDVPARVRGRDDS